MIRKTGSCSDIFQFVNLHDGPRRHRNEKLTVLFTVLNRLIRGRANRLFADVTVEIAGSFVPGQMVAALGHALGHAAASAGREMLAFRAFGIKAQEVRYPGVHHVVVAVPLQRQLAKVFFQHVREGFPYFRIGKGHAWRQPSLGADIDMMPHAFALGDLSPVGVFGRMMHIGHLICRRALSAEEIAVQLQNVPDSGSVEV